MSTIPTPKTDLHTHTIASDHADGSWEEMAQAAFEKGLQAFAVTEHGPSIARCPHIGYFANLPKIAPKNLPVMMLYGVEDDLIDTDGRTALPDEVKAQLDIVLLGTHTFGWVRNVLLSDIKKGLYKAMVNPHIDVISHPVNPWYPMDYVEIAKVALDTNTVLEFNLSKIDFQEKTWREFLGVAAEYKLPLIISSDSHSPDRIGFDNLPYEWLEGIEPSQIMNRDLPTVVERFKIKRPEVVEYAKKLKANL